MSGLRLDDCTFTGPALPEPFVAFELEKELSGSKLLPKTTGTDGQALQSSWDVYRRKLRELVSQGGPVRVRNQVVEPLVDRLGYERLEEGGEVQTREGTEAGGLVLSTAGGDRLRTWVTALGEDLDAPARRGRAYRFSHVRIAQRVLLASGERVGLLTNGIELRLLISDPARPDSQVEIAIDPHWKRSREVPDSYRLFVALASPQGVRAVPDLVDKARLQQTRVTRELRQQARQAIERFIQELLDHPENRDALTAFPDRSALPRTLWHEGLVIVYRLLFVLHLESNDDPARAFSFASTSLWRNTFSPSVTLARHAREVLDKGGETGRLLEDGLRALFAMFSDGLQCTELHVQPLGGELFGRDAAPLLSRLHWSERAVAHLLDQLLWTAQKRGTEARRRVHYGPLDVEDLGRVYEALLELEPGIASEPMCRLRRQKLEVVVPLPQGQKYRAADIADAVQVDPSEGDEEDDADDERPAKKTKVEWIEAIPPRRFYLRVGLGRKSTGSYYTPHSFVRFLVQETLGPQVAERSPHDNPRPLEILKLKVLDPAMGSGHFLVEACRFLGDKLYEACRLCDERALEAELRAEQARSDAGHDAALAEAVDWRKRVTNLPDPNDELLRYLPSRAPEGEESGLSSKKAEALCKRLVAVHCLYGVDKNPLAVELAKLALWMESHAEGLPLTFLDHRLVVGDSLTGPFFEHLLTLPGAQTPMDDLFQSGLRESFGGALEQALTHVRDLEASVGVSLAEVRAKEAAKARLDGALAPFRVVAAAWAGGVMLGREQCDDLGYQQLVQAVAGTGTVPDSLEGRLRLQQMIARGLGLPGVPTEREALFALVCGAPQSGLQATSDPVAKASAPELAAPGLPIPALPYDLVFADVFYLQGLAAKHGFDAVVGNPPWDAIQFKSKEFLASFDFSILDAPTKRERIVIEKRVLADQSVAALFERYQEAFEQQKRAHDALYEYQKVEVEGDLAGRQLDAFRIFMERNVQLLGPAGRTGVLVPSAFHANEGATGVRRLYLEQMALECCYSFENRRKLFEIDSRFKFAIVVARNGGSTTQFPCAFYLHDDEWLFSDRPGRPPLTYSLDFVRRTGGEYLSLIELKSATDLRMAESCFAHGEVLGSVCDRLGIDFRRECDMANDSWRFTPTDRVVADGEDPRDPGVARRLLTLGYLVLHEGKTFRQYDDHWGGRPRYLVSLTQLSDKPAWVRSARFFRLAYRNIAGPGDENASIWDMHPAGVATGEKGPTESAPEARPNCSALLILAVMNSFVSDWLLQLRIRATVSRFMLEATPMPSGMEVRRLTTFECHGALRLTCNHLGYESLWREQVGDVWREPTPAFTWPVLEEDDERWAVRAAIDAVVADAYGLSREQYAHVLSTFSHKSYPKAPELCLARFDDLKSIGLEAFTRLHDPYWDIPLNENLPQPVIDLPIPNESPAHRAAGKFDFEGTGNADFVPTVESAGLLMAAERQPPYETRKTRKMKGKKATDGAVEQPGGRLRHSERDADDLA